MGSISITHKLSNPWTKVASWENYWSNASERLWAGSVDINKVFPLVLDNWIAIEDDVVVFPTPPFPPTKINYKLFFSNNGANVLDIL